MLQNERLKQQSQNLKQIAIQNINNFDDFVNWINIVAPKAQLNSIAIKAVYELMLSDIKSTTNVNTNQCLGFFEKILKES